MSDERIKMTNWELQDFAVQVVRDHLEKAGKDLMSWQSHPYVDPSIWFIGKDGPEWIVVRAVRYPQPKSGLPANWQEIGDQCAHLGKVGHFVSLSIANADNTLDPNRVALPSPSWRGYPMEWHDSELERALRCSWSYAS